MPVDTNIIIFELRNGITPETFLAKIGEHSIRALTFSQTEVRMVTHLDFDDRMLEKTTDVLKKITF